MIGSYRGQGSSIPSHIRCVEALRPAWPSCIASLALLFTCTKSTIRFHAATCSGLYMPVHPGEIRPVRDTSGHLGKTNPCATDRAAAESAPSAILRVPSSATYWHIGLTTTRLLNTRSRS